MPLINFAELSRQVHLLNDLILEDMIFANEKREEELVTFSKHLFALKNWFTRISARNKRRYLLALLEDMTSAWGVAAILRCIWNCQTKDAVMSSFQAVPWSSYDRLPMDHNRTAKPLQTLAQVMKTDRKWFLSLEPDTQSVVLCELLSVSGGPIMLQLSRRAQVIYERYRNLQLKNIEMSIMVPDAPSKPVALPPASQKAESSKIASTNHSSMGMKSERQSCAQQNLNEYLYNWEKTINSMKDSLNLKEEEVTFKDGTKRKIWKVRRVQPEDVETVDFIQLLPSELGKRILSYLPQAFLAECARVNRYWAYLVDEFRTELSTRDKLNTDIDKLLNLMLKHENSLEDFNTVDISNKDASVQAISVCNISMKLKSQAPVAMKGSVKSAGAYSFRHLLNDNMNKPDATAIQVPIRNMAELSERMDRRGAVDDNLRDWCATILRKRTRRNKNMGPKTDYLHENDVGGVLALDSVHFPCPLMAKTLKLPLYPPLVVDHTARSRSKSNRNPSNATILSICKDTTNDRFCLWTRNVSRLYLASKVPSYSKIKK